MQSLKLTTIQITEFVRAIKELNASSQDKIIARFTEKQKPKLSVGAASDLNDNNIFEKVNLEEEPDKQGADTVEFNGYQEMLFDNGKENEQAPPRKSSIWQGAAGLTTSLSNAFGGSFATSK